MSVRMISGAAPAPSRCARRYSAGAPRLLRCPSPTKGAASSTSRICVSRTGRSSPATAGSPRPGRRRGGSSGRRGPRRGHSRARTTALRSRPLPGERVEVFTPAASAGRRPSSAATRVARALAGCSSSLATTAFASLGSCPPPSGSIRRPAVRCPSKQSWVLFLLVLWADPPVHRKNLKERHRTDCLLGVCEAMATT